MASCRQAFFSPSCFTYLVTEYLFVRLDSRSRVPAGDTSTLLDIVRVNALSFAVLWLSALIFAAASATQIYVFATLICALAQAVWLFQHLWFYHTRHL